jgi:prepilin-type N-terminal cleavage/methylation domain-containing protein
LGAGQISSDRFKVAPLSPSPRLRGTGAQRIARPHPDLLPQEKGQKESVGLPSGFTLIELLTVIAIIGVLTALTIPVLHAVTRMKYVSVTKAEMANLEVAIDNYHAAYGFYPPSNPNNNPTNALINQLYYELTGTSVSNAASPVYQPLFGDSPAVPAVYVQRTFGVAGFMNCTKPGGGEEQLPAKVFLPSLKPSQVSAVMTNGNTGPQGMVFLVGSVGGPDKGYAPAAVGGFNPWRYNSTAPVNNPGSYDLYIQIRIGGKTNLIANWNKSVIVDSSLP